ncbi:kelch-like protein 5 [Eurosta solidaginis]|uniref:kelch-like protein 5 n=1 Tax=Eurosta solidaginis TaxID=178769 RepID=UPI003530E545
MAMAACTTRQRLSEVDPEETKYFMEKLVHQIYAHFDEQDLVDITFKLSNPSSLITAHRLILSAASPYFRKLFKSEEGICPLIEITNIDGDIFEHLITFCYTGKTLLTIDYVDKMLKAALILQLDEAVENCVDFIIEHIADFTLQRAYNLEHEVHCEILSKKIMEYETRNFMSVVQSNVFLNFEASKLQTIIESEKLNVPCEKVAFEVVKRWYEHDVSTRKGHLPDIIACLRLTQFDTDFLMTNIFSLPGCEHLAVKIVAWLSQPSTRSKLTLKYTKKREEQIIIAEEAFLSLQLKEGTIFQYYETEDSWKEWAQIELDIHSFGVIFVDENLIFIGGKRRDKTINEVSSWNFKTKLFQYLAPMNQRRSNPNVVVLHEKIYAIGGWNQSGPLKSVEMYSVSNGWKTVSTCEPGGGDAAVTLNDKIYVVGGCFLHPSQGISKCFTCYDPITNCWTQCADMIEAPQRCIATVHNGQIFILTGTYTLQYYNPQSNIWTKICECPSRIFSEGIGLISIDKQLWAVGGNETNDVIVYDGKSGWTSKSQVPMIGPYYSFAVPKILLKTE